MPYSEALYSMHNLYCKVGLTDKAELWCCGIKGSLVLSSPQLSNSRYESNDEGNSLATHRRRKGKGRHAHTALARGAVRWA